MTAPTPSRTATESPALSALRRMFAEGFATGDGAVVDEVCAPELVEHQFGMAGVGDDARRQVKDAIAQVHAAIPDLAFRIEDWTEDGDTLWGRVRVTGTHTGPLFGPPSGRPVDITVIDVIRVVDGRIVEHWGVPDRFALLAQTRALARLAS